MSLSVYEVFYVDYIQVKNDGVKGHPQTLPKNWEDVSNFYLLEDDQLRLYGWYPVRFVPAEKTDNDIVTGQSFVIEGNEVVQYEQIREKTYSELEQETNNMWENVRNERNELLVQCDWTQISDSPLILEKKNEWKIYRQELRDITLQENSFSITWPDKP